MPTMAIGGAQQPPHAGVLSRSVGARSSIRGNGALQRFVLPKWRLLSNPSQECLPNVISDGAGAHVRGARARLPAMWYKNVPCAPRYALDVAPFVGRQ